MDLKGKTVFITGAAKRIGREIALHFARKGANVLIHYHRSLKEATCLVCELKSFGVKSKAYRANLTNARETKRLAQKILRDFSLIHVVVHNASVFYPVPFEKNSEKDWDNFLSLHLKAPFLLTQALASALKKNGRGVVIFIGDRFSGKPRKNFLAYQVSKEALLVLMKQLAFTLAPNIRVGAVCPGFVLPPEHPFSGTSTKLSRCEAPASPRPERISTYVRIGGVAGNKADGQFLEVPKEDVAKAVIFLAEQDFVTGEVLNV